MKMFLRVLAIIVIVITIMLASGFIILKRGISISELSFSNVQLSNTRLSLDNKLKLEIENITVQPAKDEPSTGTQPSYVRNVLRTVNVIERFFTSIDIKKITIGPLNASFQYRENEAGRLSINSPRLEIQSQIRAEGEFLIVDIEKISAVKYQSHASGQIRIDTTSRQLTATIEAMLAETLPLHLEVKADTEQLTFTGFGKQSVASIVPIVDLFELGPNISPWINDNLAASEISLTSVSGSIPYDNPASILQTLHAVVNVKDTEYTFAQGLEPIKASETDVIFEQGVLKIQPRNAKFYGQDTGKSRLEINFNNNPFILTAYIRTSAQASGGILSLLEHYGIPFPFEQKKGVTETDLTLAINLSTKEIDTKGTFRAENSVFEYNQQLFDVDQLDIELSNSTNIILLKLEISKSDRLSASITGELDAVKGQGDITAIINKFSYQSTHSVLRLTNPVNTPLKIHFLMRPEGDSVSVSASNWNMGDIPVSVGEFFTVFDHKNWSGKLPPTPVSIDPWFDTTVSGTFKLKPLYADLDVTLVGLTHDALRMKQPEIKIKLIISDEISLQTKNPVKLSYASTPFTLLPTHVTLAEQKLTFHQSGMELENQFSSAITGTLDFNKQTGNLTLDQIRITEQTGTKLLVVEKPVPVNLSWQGNNTLLKVPMLGIEFEKRGQGGWSVALQEFNKLHPYSPLMQDYKLQDGNLLLTSQNGSVPYSISGKLTTSEAFLFDGDKPVHDYYFRGNYDGAITSLDINDKVHIEAADKVSVSSNNVGYNLPAILNINKEVNSNQNRQNAAKNQEFKFRLNAKNSFIYLSENRRALADELTITIEKGTIDGDLRFGQGTASMQIKDDKLSLAGKGFGNQFLNELVAFLDFGKGQMEFQIGGNFDDMDAVIRIEDAVINDYGLLNNILAFINTVPSLLTFRVPNFNRNGLPVSEIDVALNISDGVVNIKSLNVDSKELDMRGEGKVNPKENTIDMVFNLITGAKKSVGRIPLLGYVLSGDEKRPSITLTLTGDMDDPKIKNTAFKEVATYPFQVLKRTVILPGQLLKKGQKETDNKNIDNRDNSGED
ncbi:MAG: hypothetical protein BMS9Abin25_1159 [Gammaproteobacteria bacterium]|nr:MAG: hypothetical protein BMS9Abin25_1159 [Gammaproteobacteria bacterium]